MMAAYYEEGLYDFRIDTQGITETKERKLPMLVFEGEPLSLIRRDAEGNEVAESVPSAPDGFPRTIRVVVDGSNDTSVDYAHKKLRYAGFEGRSFNDLDLEGKIVRARCTAGEYKNKPTEQWDLALPPMESQARPIEQKDVRSLDALFGQKLKDGTNRPAAETSKTPPMAQPELTPAGGPPEDDEDDEVPF